MTDGAGARTMTDCAVVIAAYRAEHTIDAALASVAAQQRPPREVIVVDDASPDATRSAAERWSDRLPLTVITLDVNGGPAVARDRAISATTSPLVALLDADDYWLPDHLSTLVTRWKVDGGVVSADALRWMPGRSIARRSFGDDLPMAEPNLQLCALIERNFLFMGTLFERARYDEVGGFRPQFRGTEDWDLWIRLARAGVRFTRPDHPTVLYRASEGSLSNRLAQVDQDLAVVEAALREAVGHDERAAARRATRRVRAQRALYAAYEAADSNPFRARLAATRGLFGTRRVVSRAAGMIVAPRSTARRRQAIRHIGFS